MARGVDGDGLAVVGRDIGGIDDVAVGIDLRGEGAAGGAGGLEGFLSGWEVGGLRGPGEVDGTGRAERQGGGGFGFGSSELGEPSCLGGAGGEFGDERMARAVGSGGVKIAG